MSRRNVRREQASNPDLGNSWGVLDYDQSDASSDQLSLDEDLQEPPRLPLQSTKRIRLGSRPISLDQQQREEDADLTPKARIPSARSSGNRKGHGRISDEMQNSHQTNSPAVRRVTRYASRQASTEPELLVYPSMESPSSSPRKRGRPSKQPASSIYSKSMPGKIKSTVEHKESTNTADSGPEYLQILWQNILKPSLGYFLSLLFDVLRILRQPIALVIALLVGYALLQSVWQKSFLNPLGYIQSTVGSLVSPCSIPIISTLSPLCSSENEKPPEFEHLVEVQDTFGKMLDIVEPGHSLPLQIRLSQMPLLELKDQIAYQSTLPSKHELMLELDNFVEMGRLVSRKLITFNTRVGGSVDRIVSANRDTLRVLVIYNSRAAGASALDRLLDTLIPSGLINKRAVSELDVVKQYLKHADQIEDQIQHLLVEAVAVEKLLDGMDEQANKLRDLANRDKANVIENQEELFAKLWTKFGGNSRDKKKLAKNIALVNDLSETRKKAARLIKLVLNELYQLEDNIQDLKDRVAEPRSYKQLTSMDIESHLLHIEDGLDRLFNKRSADQKLQMKRIDDLFSTASGSKPAATRLEIE